MAQGKDMTQNNSYNSTALIISDRLLSNGTYCSFRASYGKVIALLDDVGASEHIDEGLYFKALVAKKILTKGKLLKTGFVPDAHGIHLPPAAIAEVMYDDEDAVIGIYRRKRGTFGFNCDKEDTLNEKALQPVAEFLRRLNIELEKVEEEVLKAKKLMKSAGLPLSMIDRNGKRKSVISRMLRDEER